MSRRIELRASYLQGWYEMNAELLLAATAKDFFFDDPAEPEPVTRAMLADYMIRWEARTGVKGAHNNWILSHEVRQDRDGILTDWEWWKLVGSDLCGAGLVQTSDDGVLFERIAYFDRCKHQHS